MSTSVFLPKYIRRTDLPFRERLRLGSQLNFFQATERLANYRTNIK